MKTILLICLTVSFVFVLVYCFLDETMMINFKSVWLRDNSSRIYMDLCKCQRNIKPFNQSATNIQFNETTCSKEAYLRGPHQKVIGFSFYGDINSDISKKKGYFEGIMGNLQLVHRFYPGWIMRVYYDLDKKDSIFHELCKLACRYENIDICDARNLPGTPYVDASEVFAMNWRFFPTLDPQVDVYVSRDLDSRFSQREYGAVNEWIRSDKVFHFMRDHPAHTTTILGCAWGSKLPNEKVRDRWKKSWRSMFMDKIAWAKRSEKGPDQKILDRHVWHWARKNSMSHDSYLCQMYPNTRPWPTRRKNEPNNFVGAVTKENVSLWKQCPKVCRPKKHQDWEYC